MIDGFRYGFFGVADVNPWLSLTVVAVTLVALAFTQVQVHSLTVTLLDGLVLARSAFESSMNYRSVMVLGTAHRLSGDDELDALLFFCSSRFDLQVLADGLASTFAEVPCVVGCTTAGQIGPRGFQTGLTAIGFRSGSVAVTPYVIEPLSSTSLR
jgi:hypothetical protein